MDSHTGSFGERLRYFRVQAGLSQVELAERANLSPAAVTTLERGVRRLPHPRTVDALAGALRLSAADHAVLVARPSARRACGSRPRVCQSRRSARPYGCRSG
jgi:transcriptional regulator with XRE-family HTH domain